jgi:hypothetical protein
VSFCVVIAIFSWQWRADGDGRKAVCTLADRLRGARDDPLKIMQRCGHRDYATTLRYVREAEAVREGFGEPFPALPARLIEPSPLPSPPHGTLVARAESATESSAFLDDMSGVDGTRSRDRDQAKVVENTRNYAIGSRMESPGLVTTRDQPRPVAPIRGAISDAAPTVNRAHLAGGIASAAMLVLVNSQPPLEEALEALRRDPTHPVRVRVDDDLTIEVRAVEREPSNKRTVGDLLHEIGRWEGETGPALDALFERQAGTRRVPPLS